MAEKRMLARAIVRSDAFCGMTPAAQLVYYHMAMDADDDGVCGSMRMILSDAQAGPDALEELTARKFVLKVGNVYIIKHWHMMNTIREDRKTPSTYQDELSLVERKKDKSYAVKPVEKLGKTRDFPRT